MSITKAIETTKKELGFSLEILTEWICEGFAELVVDKVPGAEACWDCDIDPNQQDIPTNKRDPSHCFVSYNGKYYDAACPDGVDDWRNLPFFRMHMRAYMTEHEKEEFTVKQLRDWAADGTEDMAEHEKEEFIVKRLRDWGELI